MWDSWPEWPAASGTAYDMKLLLKSDFWIRLHQMGLGSLPLDWAFTMTVWDCGSKVMGCAASVGYSYCM